MPRLVVQHGVDNKKMMKRRWSNNGGFTLRNLEESSSEVTSSSALAMSPAVAMSPTSIGSAEYNDMDGWGYDDSSYSTATPSIITAPNSVGCNMNNPNSVQASIQQAFAASLPGMQILNGISGGSVRSTSVNSISPGNNHFMFALFSLSPSHALCCVPCRQKRCQPASIEAEFFIYFFSLLLQLLKCALICGRPLGDE